MRCFLHHDPALSTSTMIVAVLIARPRADLEREVRPATWRTRAPTIVS
jgi:hypothetical protein